MNKRIATIGPEDMDALANYHWPGTVRELQNVIERCVILSSDTVLAHPILGQSKPPETNDSLAGRTLAQVQRQHILQALQATDWVIVGPDGATARLGLKLNTLLYNIRHLGIFRTVTLRNCP